MIVRDRLQQASSFFAASLVCIGLYFKLMNRAMRGLSA